MKKRSKTQILTTRNIGTTSKSTWWRRSLARWPNQRISWWIFTTNNPIDLIQEHKEALTTVINKPKSIDKHKKLTKLKCKDWWITSKEKLLQIQSFHFFTSTTETRTKFSSFYSLISEKSSSVFNVIHNYYQISFYITSPKILPSFFKIISKFYAIFFANMRSLML